MALEMARDLAQLVRNIDGYGLEETRTRVIDAARLSLGCAGASLWQLSRPGEAHLDASTDATLARSLARRLSKNPEGPMWEAATTRKTVVCPDFTTERRWPGYIDQVMSETTARSSVAYPLVSGGHDSSVLALYSDQAGYFTSPVVQLGMTFAIHAAIVLEKSAMRDRNENLHVALSSNRRIGMAIGVLMAQRKVTEEQAFGMLRAVSQCSHVKLYEVAEQVLLTGELDSVPMAQSA